MNNKVRLQNLIDFTVKITHSKTGNPVGTGVVISMDGEIITCAHVLREAGIEPRKARNKTVGIYFPQVRGQEEKKRKARIKTFLPKQEDDLVLLQLTDGPSPLAPEQIAQLGIAEESDHHEFRSYGFSSIGKYLARYAEGRIMGPTGVAESNLLANPIELRTRDIRPGLSGAGVLDVEKNRIVGLVTQRWNPAGETEDDNIGWATDTVVLTFSPFDFDLLSEPYPKREAPSPKTDIIQAEAAVFIKDKYSWNSAPSVLPEWTGRDDLLAQITEDWNNPQKHVTGLIGFGGEGKSSLARKWVETLNLQPATFDGLFWWGFYENRSIDEFLEAALNYLSGGKIDPRQVPSSSLRAQIIGAMLGVGRYLFVLDGLEVLQHQEGDQYGLLQSNDLRDLLTYFARPDNQSFCLITSRAPILDLMEYTTYTHRDVNRLSEVDGILLLEKLGVKPSPRGRGQGEGLAKVVSDWDGHALTISLLGSYLAEKYNGDIAHLADIPIPTADEPRYERVHRVLRRYDEHLTVVEREFLKLFSAFRTPVHESAFEKVFVPLLANVGATRPVQTESLFGKLFKQKKTTDSIDESPLRDIVSHLVTYRILHCDAISQTYTAHPLVRNHYLAILTHGDSTEQQDVHGKIKDYYLSIAGDTPQYPTLDDLKPLIEVVHHACQAGAYDEAHNIRRDRIDQGTKFILIHQLGAYDTALNLMYEFFPNSDTTKEPLCIEPSAIRFIVHHVGFCLMCTGRLREAVPFYERAGKAINEAQDWNNASGSYQNLADLYVQLGVLDKSAEAARQALDLARNVENKQYEYTSLTYQAWVLHLMGKLPSASLAFDQAEKLIKELFSQLRYLFSLWGIKHADHLRRKNDFDYARRVTVANMEQCELGHWTFLLSQCHRVLGDLDFDSSNYESARAHYESALKIARSISNRNVLIEALLALGRFYAKVAVGATHPARTYIASGSTTMQDKTTDGIDGSPLPLTDAFTDLNEALNYAVEGGYRIYEADIRVALAWAYLANGEKEKAQQSTQRALQMSQEMGYHWGKVDAEEVLERMNKPVG